MPTCTQVGIPYVLRRFRKPARGSRDARIFKEEGKLHQELLQFIPVLLPANVCSFCFGTDKIVSFLSEILAGLGLGLGTPFCCPLPFLLARGARPLAGLIAS